MKRKRERGGERKGKKRGRERREGGRERECVHYLNNEYVIVFLFHTAYMCTQFQCLLIVSITYTSLH